MALSALLSLILFLRHKLLSLMPIAQHMADVFINATTDAFFNELLKARYVAFYNYGTW